MYSSFYLFQQNFGLVGDDKRFEGGKSVRLVRWKLQVLSVKKFTTFILKILYVNDPTFMNDPLTIQLHSQACTLQCSCRL